MTDKHLRTSYLSLQVIHVVLTLINIFPWHFNAEELSLFSDILILKGLSG